MIKDNRGFTLVELLAVIVILISISSITVMGITASLEKRDEKECSEQKELAKNAAKIYFSLGTETSVTVKKLKDNNYFSSDSKTSKLGDSDNISITDGVITYNGTCK